MSHVLNGPILPSSWETPTFADITHLITKGASPRWQGFDYQDTGTPFVRSQNILWGKLSLESVAYLSPEFNQKQKKSVIQIDDILLNIVGASIGRAAKATSAIAGGNLNQAVAIIRLVAPYINETYAVWYLLSTQAQKHIDLTKVDVARANFSLTDIKHMSLPLAPLNEQHRIVDAIETQFTRLDAAVAALKRTQANLKRYRASVLKAACEGRLVPTEAELAQAEGSSYEPAAELLQRILIERRQKWKADAWQKEIDKAKQKAAKAQRKADGRPLQRGEKLDPAAWQSLTEEVYSRYLPKNEKWKEKYKEPEPPDTTDLPDLPDGWCWTGLGQLVSRIEAGKSPKAENRPAMPHEIGVLKVSAVSWGKFQQKENKTLSVSSIPDVQYTVNAGDVLISRANTVELVGAVVLVRHDYPNLLLSDKTLRLVFSSDELPRYYMIQALRAPWARKVYERDATGTSDSMRNLSQDKILSAPIPLPPAAEQKRIVAEVERRLSIADQMEKTVETDLARAERLRQSILKQAFEGKLVPQDPNDEPASALLERIQAQRNGQPKQQKLSLNS